MSDVGQRFQKGALKQAKSSAIALEEKDVIEFLLLLFILLSVVNLLGLRQKRRLRLLDSAFRRASNARVVGAGTAGFVTSYPATRSIGTR
jgi:hypothetical protein